MIRFDQRNLDVQATERVYKKVVHPSPQALRLVDKDGVPLRSAPQAAQGLARLHSSFTLSPRGVPQRKSNHAYSGQLSSARMQNLIKNLEPAHQQQEMQSYTSMHNYGTTGSGLSSAASSRHYMSNKMTPKKRGFGSGPPGPCSIKSMPAKSASSQRTGRYLTTGMLAPDARRIPSLSSREGTHPPGSIYHLPDSYAYDLGRLKLSELASMPKSLAPTHSALQSAGVSDLEHDPDAMAYEIYEKTNDSAQGKRLEKEWSAMSQCRAMKRSSEIVSHRVDRMYFMTGNKLPLSSKYHVEDDELKQLRELSQARTSSRASRSSKTRKGDVYRPIRSSLSQKTLTNGEDHDHSNGSSLIQKENADPSIVVTQKPITHKRISGAKSPLQGWGDEDKAAKDLPEGHDIVSNTSLHKDQDKTDAHKPEHEENKIATEQEKAENEEGVNVHNGNVQDTEHGQESGNNVKNEQNNEGVNEAQAERAETVQEAGNSEQIVAGGEKDNAGSEGRTFLTEGNSGQDGRKGTPDADVQ